MYLRSTKRKNKDGSVTEYYQLAHNERHPETRKPVAQIIHNFGRADQLDREELVRLCRSIARVCGIDIINPSDDSKSGDIFKLSADLRISKTLSMGRSYVIEKLWERLGERFCKISQTPKGLKFRMNALYWP